MSASKNFCFANKAYQPSGTNEFNDSASLKEQTRRCFFKYLQYSRGVETMEEKKKTLGPRFKGTTNARRAQYRLLSRLIKGKLTRVRARWKFIKLKSN